MKQGKIGEAEMAWSRWIDGNWVEQPPCAPGAPLGSKAGLLALKAAFDNLRDQPLQKMHAVSPGPARPAAVSASAGPPSAFQQARELAEQHRREDTVIRRVLRLARAARRPTRWPERARPRGRVRAPRRRMGTSRHCGRAPPGDDGGGGGGSDPPAPQQTDSVTKGGVNPTSAHGLRSDRVLEQGRAR
jgi:hypothetical protein